MRSYISFQDSSVLYVGRFIWIYMKVILATKELEFLRCNIFKCIMPNEASILSNCYENISEKNT